MHHTVVEKYRRGTVFLKKNYPFCV